MKEKLIYRTVPNVFCCCYFKLREKKCSKLAEFYQNKPYNGTNYSILCIEQTSHNILNGPVGIQNKHCSFISKKCKMLASPPLLQAYRGELANMDASRRDFRLGCYDLFS